MYIVNDDIFNILFKYQNEIDLFTLLYNSLLFIKLEIRFSRKVLDNKTIHFIGPYLQVLFKYILFLLENDSSMCKVEQLLSTIFSIENDDPFYSLMILKEYVGISKPLYDKIKSIPGVIESDKIFYEKNKDFQTHEVKKEIIIVESEHPYNLTPKQ